MRNQILRVFVKSWMLSFWRCLSLVLLTYVHVHPRSKIKLKRLDTDYKTQPQTFDRIWSLLLLSHFSRRRCESLFFKRRLFLRINMTIFQRFRIFFEYSTIDNIKIVVTSICVSHIKFEKKETLDYETNENINCFNFSNRINRICIWCFVCFEDWKMTRVNLCQLHKWTIIRKP